MKLITKYCFWGWENRLQRISQHVTWFNVPYDSIIVRGWKTTVQAHGFVEFVAIYIPAVTMLSPVHFYDITNWIILLSMNVTKCNSDSSHPTLVSCAPSLAKSSITIIIGEEERNFQILIIYERAIKIFSRRLCCSSFKSRNVRYDKLTVKHEYMRGSLQS